MDTALFILHAVVGLLFIGHGSQKLFGWFGGYGLDGTAGYMESLGLRPGRLHATLAGSAEVAAGVLLAAGLLLPLAAALITAVMVTATLTEHRGKGVWNDSGGFELPLVFVAVVFTLAAVGGGALSLDTALGLDLQGLGWGVGAVGAATFAALANLGLNRLFANRADRSAAAV